MTRYSREDLGDELADVREDQGIPDLLEDTAEDLIIALTHALHRFGLPGYHLELSFRSLSHAFGISGQLLAMPTSLVFAFGEGTHQRTALLRVQPASIDLGRLAEIDRLTRRVIRHDIDRGTARSELRALLMGPRRWPWPADLVAGGVASATAAALFPGASLSDLFAASLAGVFVATLAILSERSRWLSNSWIVLSAFGATLIGALAASQLPDTHASLIAIAGVILLVPGLSFTITMMELSHQNLSSAVARFAAVVLTLVQLGLGLAVARGLLLWPADPAPSTLPGWVLPAALALLPLAIAELMGARARDLPIILIAALLGWAGTQVGQTMLTSMAAPTFGTITLGLFCNLYERRTGRPAIIPTVTGLFLLVPGSLGLRGMDALLVGETLAGIETLFNMAMGAFALAAGLVVAHAILPPREE